jgi:predicted CoA-binding protein
MNNLAAIESFLEQKQIAIVGVSRDPRHFSRTLYDEFVKRGYNVEAVNPGIRELRGRTCFGRIAEVQPAPPAVLVMTGQSQRDAVVRECKEAGVRYVWTYGTNGRDKLSAQIVDECEKAGVTLVQGECPFMFLPRSGGIHRFHGFLRKVFRSYPA